jgi:hypothetical protein
LETKKRENEKTEERKRFYEIRKQRQEIERLSSIQTPPAVEGRRHSDIQTDQYLEIITDREIESEAFTQTDPFMDRPKSALFIPAKSGVDVSTQIEEDLFKFDHEVEPILEVLVGKTLEQSMLEVLQEEEMKAIQEAQKLFEQQRNAALVEAQKMEAMEIRRFEEKERRTSQEKDRLQRENQTKEKLSSRTFAKSFLSNLETKVFGKLENQGFFYDVVRREVEAEFMPWLIDSVIANIDKNKTSRQMVDDLIKLTVKKLMETGVKAREERDRLATEEVERKRRQEEEAQAQEDAENENEVDLGATMQITSDMIEQPQDTLGEDVDE